MEIVLQILVGVGLAATCGFRVFVPLFVMGIAGMGGYLQLAPGFTWISSPAAVIVFGIATIIEIAAYFIPYVDNLLDSISIPASIIAGIVVAASVITDINPLLRWTLVIIAGGGIAAVTSLISNGAHGVSTVASGGTANPALSGAESVLSVISAVVSIAVPILVIVLLAVLVIIAFRLMRKYKKKQRSHRSSG
jgi:type II secretory pathway component PulF